MSDPKQYGTLTLWELPDGTIHREDGPAVISRNGIEYWIKNKQHRLDGPAIILNNGGKQWWINGRNVTNKIRQWAEEFNIDLDNLTDEDKQMIALYWADYGK